MTEPSPELPDRNSASPENPVSEVDTLPYRLGFEETAELSLLHHRIVIAVRDGNNEDRRRALDDYLNLAEPIAAASGHASPQIGLIIAEALIWREAGETVKYLRAILEALEYADNMGFDDVATVLQGESVNASGELLQAEAEYERAIEAYIEGEQEALTDTQRGILNLRMAECYESLILADSDSDGSLQNLRDMSVESAFAYLKGTTEEAKIRAFVETLQ